MNVRRLSSCSNSSTYVHNTACPTHVGAPGKLVVLTPLQTTFFKILGLDRTGKYLWGHLHSRVEN